MDLRQPASRNRLVSWSESAPVMIVCVMGQGYDKGPSKSRFSDDLLIELFVSRAVRDAHRFDPFMELEA